MELNEIARQKYVSLTTFRKDGTPRSSPVWIVSLGDGSVGFTTDADSFKAKRIRRDPSVTLRPRDMRGHVADDAPTVAGRARLVHDDDAAQVRDRVQRKYGLMYRFVSITHRITALLGRSTPSGSAVVIEPAL